MGRLIPGSLPETAAGQPAGYETDGGTTPPPAEGGQPWQPSALQVEAGRKFAVLFFYCNTAKGGDAVCDCLLMRRTTFPHARLSEFLDAFDWYEMDVDGPEAAPYLERYRIQRSPTFIVVDQAGQELWRVSGHKQAGEMASQLQSLLRTVEAARQRHERTLGELVERTVQARDAMDRGDWKTALRSLQLIQRTARSGGYTQWVDQAEEGLTSLRGRLEILLSDLERRAPADPEGVAREAREFRQGYGSAFPDLARRAGEIGG